MAQATNTSLGEIKLAGDLGGSNNALLPELSTTGVTAGQYVVPTITVDAKGRITAASNTTGSALAALMPDATTSTKGVMQVGTGLNVNNGTVNADIGSTVQKGIVQIGSGLNVTSGVVSLDTTAVPNATTSTKGAVQVGSGLTVTSGTIALDTSALPQATTSTLGTVKIGTGLSVTGGVVSVAATPDATTSTKGIVQVPTGSGLSVSSGVLSGVDGSTSAKGVLQVGSGLTATSGTVALDRTAYASAGTAGLVKVGSGLSIDGTGVLNVNMSTVPDATTSTKGIVQVGSGINLASGVISIDPLPIATASTLGAVKIGSGVSIDGTGTISVSTSYPDATQVSKGVVQINTTSALTVTNGILSAGVATTNNLGLMKIGSGFNIAGDGTLSAPIASASVLGVVKVDGSTITAATDGTLSASGSAYANATTTSKGVVQVGTGINVSSGVISLATASGSTTFGVVKGDGSTVSITNGVISINTANVVMKNTYTTTTKAIHTAASTFSPSSNTNYTLDLQSTNCFKFIISGSSTAVGFFAPSNAEIGMTFRIIMRQGSTPTTVQPTFNGVFVFPSAYTMSSGALYGDLLECVVVNDAAGGGLKILTKVLATGIYGI